MGGGGACVSCRGTLRVETVSTEDPSQPLYNVVITANGPGGFSRTRTSRRRRGRAIANFGRVRPGNYTIVIGGGNAAEGAVQARQTTEITVRLAVPSITVAAPKVVLVKKQYQDGTDGLNPHRISVQLRASSNFGGTGRFTCNHTNHIRLYDAETGGNQINLPYDVPGGELAAGKTVYVEGAQPSVRMNNTRLTLTLQGGSPAGWGTAREDITCVELKLEICKWRTSRRAYPRPFSENEKHDPGRYVCLYDGQGSTERAMMILHKARPHNYNGTLSLIPLVPPDNRVQVFESEQGGAPLPDTYTIANRRVSPSGKRLWVQGRNVSGGLRDTGFRLELQDPANKEGDRVRITVVRLRMDCCKARTAAGVDPVPFSNNDKVTIGRFIHVQNPANQHERGKLIVNRVQPNAFNGTLVLTLVEPRRGNPLNKAQLFDNENPAAPAGQVAHPNPYEFNHGGTFPAAGRAFWLEGRNESRRARDTEVWLGIRDHIKRGDRVPVTVVKGFLDIYQSRTRRNRDPRAMTPNDKVNVGRFVHIQMGNHHGRALTVAKRLKPNDANCTLVLTVCDTAGAASNRVQLFDQEVAPAGAVQANPLEIAHDGAFPRNGRRLWTQGNTVSGALRDTEIRLGIKDHIARYDRVTLTVVEFTSIQATIHPTPANTPANSANMTPPVALPADHVFQRNQHSEDFAVNSPLVLMRNAQPDIQLEVTANPAAPVDLPIRWDAIRNPDDHGSLGGRRAVPTVTRDAANPRRATLNANQKGSFRIRPYIDCNGTNSYNEGEPSIPLNLVLADATVVADNSVADPTNINAGFIAAGFNVRNGAWNAGLAGAGMAMELVANVTGGGADGTLGLNCVFAGLVNVNQVRDVYGIYRDSTVAPPTDHRLSFIAPSNQNQATGNFHGRPMFQPGDPAPVLFIQPLLDSGRVNAGLGAEDATMGGSGPANRTPRAVGEQWTIQCIDSPGVTFPQNHPARPAAILRNMHYRYRFTACFCFWTNITPTRARTNNTAERVYSVIRIVDWAVDGDWDINYAVAPPTMAVNTAHNISVTNRATVRPIGRAQDHAIEVRPPSGIRVAGFDGR